MCHEPLKRSAGLHLMIIAIALGTAGPASALNYFWTGDVSTDAADPNNWLNDGGATMAGTLPNNDDTVRIGCTTDWQYFVPANQPVLTSEWKSRANDASAGWWLIMGSTENSVTVGDGAYIEWSHNDCTIRNGSILRVTGQRTGGGPSMVIAPRFRIGNNGDSVPAATGTIIVEDNGHLRLDPKVSRKGSGGWQIYMGSATRALIEIRDKGILELVQSADGTTIPRFVFASADPAANRIVISGQGQLLLTGDPAAIAQVEGADVPLQRLIDTGLIAPANPDEQLVFSGGNPTVVKLAGQRVSNPKPTEGESDVDRYAVLRWDAGTMADKYDVYLGTDAAVVVEASRDNPSGVLQSQDQVQACYPLGGMLTLEYGRTYSWRVDEAAKDPGQGILKGKVWSFTTEPYAIPIPAASLSATASGQSPDQGPEKTIDRSGLDANDCHSIVSADMWLSDAGASAWIEYAFDHACKVRQMLVWNFNGEEFLTALGLRDVTVEYSPDGADWVALPGVSTFEQATGAADYAANTIVDFGDVVARKVKITVHSNWGDNPLFNRYGLSEVRFLHIPVVARQPNPESGAAGVSIDGPLTWRAGREAAEHNVYLSTDQAAVADSATPTMVVQQAEYNPAALILDTTYFWRVDEVNQAETPAVWPGEVWSFTTADCVAVDDFESYINDSPKRVFQAWIDGLGFSPDEFFANGHGGNGTGAVVGYDPEAGSVMENGIVHGGKQSMPLTYDGLSETTRTFEPAQDWTRGGITTLVLFFQGASTNVSGELYVKINGVKVPYSGDAGDLTLAGWKQWNIALPASAGLGAVKSLTIGISSGQGMLYIDDIGLYRSAPAVTP